MKVINVFLKVVLGLVTLIVIGVFTLSSMHESLDQFDNDFVGATAIDNGDVSVRFMGNTNLLFSDGETNILIDGWFSRPSLFELALTDIEPDMLAIDAAFERGEITNIDAVITVHSHYDHAMDAPEVAKRSGASLLGSESTANIARGWGLAEEQIELAQIGRRYSYGKFKVSMIPSAHFEFPNSKLHQAALGDIVITESLVPPVNVAEYKMGGAYSVYIEHPKGSALVQGSAGYIPNSLDHLTVDVAFLGIGGLNSQTQAYQDAYWQHSVTAIKPRQIYPIHWDSLTHDLGERPIMPDLLISNLLKFSSRTSLQQTFDAAANDDINIALLPMWAPIRLFE